MFQLSGLYRKRKQLKVFAWAAIGLTCLVLLLVWRRLLGDKGGRGVPSLWSPGIHGSDRS